MYPFHGNGRPKACHSPPGEGVSVSGRKPVARAMIEARPKRARRVRRPSMFFLSMIQLSVRSFAKMLCNLGCSGFSLTNIPSNDLNACESLLDRS